MTQKLRKVLHISLALMVVAAFAMIIGGCTPPGEKGGEEEGTPKVTEYKIGAIFSVTGKASFLGDPEKKTVEMLVEQINAAGGINGIPIKAIIEDDAGLEDKTKQAAARLIEKEEVLAIIGPSRSGNTMAIKDMMGEKKVPLISCAAAEAIVNPVNPWVFKTPQKDSFVATKILSYMKDHSITNIAVLYGNTGFGQQGLKQIKSLAPKFNVTVAFEEAFQPAATDGDIETLLTKVKSAGDIQAIVDWTILPTQSVIPKKMKALEMANIVLFQSHGFGNIKYVRDAGAAANGIIFPAGRLLVAAKLPDSNPQKALLVKYKDEYEKKYGGDVSTFGGHAYDAFTILVEAIKVAGADRQGIRDAIENIKDFPGTGGVFTFSKEDHNGLDINSLEMLTVRNEQFDLLNP